MKIFMIASLASLCAFSQPAQATTVTLASLLSGDTLEQDDITFSNFAVNDNLPSPALPGDFTPDPDQVDVTTSATDSSVTLSFNFVPAVGVSGIDLGTSLEHTFDFFIDLDVAVIGASSRRMTKLTLGGGDLSAERDAFAEVQYFDSDAFDNLVGQIFEDPSNEDPALRSLKSDSTGLSNLTSLSLFGSIEGETNEAGAIAGLSTFALTFDLEGTSPVTPVPLPASLPLILAGLGALALLRRRNSV